MDQNQQNTSPIITPPTMPRNMNGSGLPGNEHKKVGPIIATLIIIVILICAALYVFATRINQSAIPTDTGDTGTTGDTSSLGDGTSAANTPSVQPVTATSTDLNSIQNDLNTSTRGVDQQNF